MVYVTIVNHANIKYIKKLKIKPKLSKMEKVRAILLALI